MQIFDAYLHLLHSLILDGVQIMHQGLLSHPKTLNET
jgi:hypothetical protein